MAHKSVDQLFNEFRENPDLVVISDQEAMAIYDFFMGYQVHVSNLQKPGAKAFLQAAMTGALDASNDIGWVQALWQGTATPSSSARQAISKIIRAFGKRLLTRSFSEDPEIYESVKNSIKLYHRTRFEAITQLDDVI